MTDALRTWRRMAGAVLLVMLGGGPATSLPDPGPGRPGAGSEAFDPALALVALRLAAPDPMTSTPEAGRDAARAEVAAGVLLTDQLARAGAAGVDLMAPTPGPVLEVFGHLQPGGIKAAGLTFQAPPGGLVRAPADGDVLHVGPAEGVGEVVILQATPRGQVILSGDFAASVRAGATVTKGQALGRAGGRGAAARLYLELRDLGRPIDPQPWIRPEKAASEGSGFKRETG